jgi:hypothetical protein
LAESVDARRVLAFRLSDSKQPRLGELLEKNREGRLTDAGLGELDAYERFEHVVRLLFHPRPQHDQITSGSMARTSAA